MKKKKVESLKADPKRQADDKLKGYLYQIWHSVNAWLDLAEDEILYLEGAEDFDKVSDGSATAVQIKNTQHKITLRSEEVNDAINHYWRLRNNHPDLCVKFRFLTRSKIGKERGNPFGEDQAGLHLWNRCSADKTSIAKISKFLQSEGKISAEIDDFLEQAESERIYEQLIKPVTWETDSKEASFVEKSISDKLILHGDRYNIPPSYSSKVVDHLLREAFNVATQKNNRELTKARFLEIFEEKTTQRVPIQNLRYMQIPSVEMNTIGSPFSGGSSGITIQSQSSIQTSIPPLYPDSIPRTTLVEGVQTKLKSEGLAVIQGGTGVGKTTLAKLTANAIAGSWFWVNFSKRDSSQGVQFLQQLALVISNQASQTNIVLDDLNLQPQESRQYEEALGVLVYRVLENSAKLLITSQHRLPNNLMRRLGVSKSVVVPVSKFTMLEIEQFAQQLGCSANKAKTWAKLIQFHTSGHPRLVHARLARLREKGWIQNQKESILQTPPEVVEEREEARKLLLDLPKDHREILYRLSLISIEFRRDCALNIGEIPEPIPHPGDIFNQLVGPWIDPSKETYYKISPLLYNAANQIWPEEKITKIRGQIADAIIKTKNLTVIEAFAALLNSMVGENKEGLISIIHALNAVSIEHWKKLSQEFSWFIYVKTNPPEELYPEDVAVNHELRSLQYRITVEVEPDFAPKVLQVWDNETKPYKPHKLYLLSRMNLATQVLVNYQVLLPVKQMVGYLKELIDIEDRYGEIREIREAFSVLIGQLEKEMTGKSSLFSTLFWLILARRPIYASFLSDLIDALDDLCQKIRTLLLPDFENDIIFTRILIDNVWLAEADLESPDWIRCLQVYDKVIEKAIAWGYPQIVSAAARGKAIIHDEYLQDPDTAHIILQDVISKVGSSRVLEEAQAVTYSNHKHYRDALKIYERILPTWNTSSELEMDFVILEGYRRAGICAANLDDWEKAAAFFEEGGRAGLEIGGTKRDIGLHADAGFAQFKAGNMSDCMRLLNLAFKKFEMLPQDNMDVEYFTLKKRLGHTVIWLAQQTINKNNISIEEAVEPPPGCCSDIETDEKILTLPDVPTGYSRLSLARIEYKFGLGTTAFQQIFHMRDREAYPPLNVFFLLLKMQYDFKNRTFDDLPDRVYQLASAYASVQKHNQSEKGIGEKGCYSLSVADLSIFASLENITNLLVAALLVQLSENMDITKILPTWRRRSLELPIEENLIVSLDLIESMLSGDWSKASTAMRAQETKPEDRIVAALKIVHNIDTDPENLFYAHALFATYTTEKGKKLGLEWEEQIFPDLAELFSRQWLEIIKFRALLKTPQITVPQIERACNSSETGKKKMAHILLAAHEAVTLKLPPEVLEQLRGWMEDVSMSKSMIKFTYQDYLNTPEDKRYELLDGDLVMAPAPGELHQSVSAQLGFRLVKFAYENRLGRVYHAPFDVVLSDTNVVQPDLLFVSNERLQIITTENIQGAPDLVVEILSPSTAERDRTFKRTLYAKHGVKEYWMVDTDKKELTVLLLGEFGYEIVDVYGEGKTLTSTIVKEFALNISDIF